MNKLVIPAIIVSIVGAIAVLLVSIVCVLGIYNDEASLKNLYDMKVKDNSSEFDNMWKKISQAAQIADNQKDAFKEIFQQWAQNSTPQDGGKMMLWIKQVSPDVGGITTVQTQVMNIMVGSRDGWTMRQKELVSIASTYNDNLVRQPRGFILGLFGFKHIDPLVITSSRTDAAFKTGKDDDVDIRSKPAAPAPAK